jgi:hypothetical protein
MKKTILILLSVALFSCCGVKESQEETAKQLSDTRASNVMLRASNAHKDSVLVAYKDTAQLYHECKQDVKQMEYWNK